MSDEIKGHVEIHLYNGEILVLANATVVKDTENHIAFKSNGKRWWFPTSKLLYSIWTDAE